MSSGYSGCPVSRVCQIDPICNIYRIDPKPGKGQRVRVRIAEAASKLASALGKATKKASFS